jgi:hypothetical protein
MTTRVGTSSEGFNLSVRLRTPQAEELYEYRCEAGHVRTPDNTTTSGHCRQCATTRYKRSRWIRHEVVAKPKDVEVENLWFLAYEQRQREKELAEQQREQQRRDRDAQELQRQTALDAACDLMDATESEKAIVNRRARGIAGPASEFVKELKKLRAERAT